MNELKVIIPYLIGVNIVGLFLMGFDKQKAKNRAWRIPERTLWGISILGGASGSYIGMKLFRHKTNHRSFIVGMPVLIIGHLLFLVYIYVS